MSIQDFRTLGLAESLLRTAATCGYTVPTPIQAGAIPALVEGRDLLGLAQTGTGKTAAFTLPMLHRLAASGARDKRIPKAPRALILTPTRELAVQRSEEHTSELQSLMRISYAVFCLKKK